MKTTGALQSFQRHTLRVNDFLIEDSYQIKENMLQSQNHFKYFDNLFRASLPLVLNAWLHCIASTSMTDAVPQNQIATMKKVTYKRNVLVYTSQRTI